MKILREKYLPNMLNNQPLREKIFYGIEGERRKN